MAERNGHFFKGLFIGGLIGAVIGILYAPKSGKETRENLARQADEIIAKAKEGFEENKEANEEELKRLENMESSVRDKASEVENKISEFTHQSAKAVQDSKKRLKKAIYAGVEAYREKKKKKLF
jgi:gas vesicle protein